MNSRTPRSQKSNQNKYIPILDCYYPQRNLGKESYHPASVLVPNKTHSFSQEKTLLAGPSDSVNLEQNSKKQVNFVADTTKGKNYSAASVRSPLLADCDAKEEGCDKEQQNRHLSDIELLRQVYEELRHKLSQRSV
ncbi:unnamed protein product [Gongylonema pulchrum]|uniref:CEP57L1 n=1 Tax=Gongylonema pulchrum TaxID=637853 RepID=A0A183DP70_9BILA|nr:unnamed protein product [Gongylonema pulchrum]